MQSHGCRAQMLERFWLASGTFLAGSEISIADLLLVTELDMLHMLAGATEVCTPTVTRMWHMMSWECSDFKSGC